jgi:hypothetical protein
MWALPIEFRYSVLTTFRRISAKTNELFLQGGPAVTGFPAVDGVLAVASFPDDPSVPILAGGFAHL